MEFNLGIRKIPFRNTYTYFIFPSKRNYTGTIKYVTEISKIAEKDSIIVTDSTIGNAIKAAQLVYGIRKDLLICSYLKKEDLKRFVYQDKPIYITSVERGYFPVWLNKYNLKYKIIPEGILYKVEVEKNEFL